MRRLVVTLCLGLGFTSVICNVKAGGDGVSIQEGKKVSFNYTLTVEGEVIDSSDGREPFEYTHGKGQIIPGLSKQLTGLRVGDEKVIKIPPEEGYGQINPEAIHEVPLTSLPADLDPEVGMYLQMQGPDGQSMPVKVTELKEETIVLDLNHPLAGKTLTFQVKVLSIE